MIGVITSLGIEKRLLHVRIEADGMSIEQIYHKHEAAFLRLLLNNYMQNGDKPISRVGHIFTWDWLKGKLYPTSYIGTDSKLILKEKPLVVDANSPSLRNTLPETWYRVEQLWLKRGGGDVQFYTHEGQLVAIEHKKFPDLLSSMGEQEFMDGTDKKESRMTRQVKHILQADIAYLIIEGRNHKIDPNGQICITQNYKEWHTTGWTAKSLDAFKLSWIEAGVRILETESEAHTSQLILVLYSYWQKKKHPYLNGLRREI